MNLRRLLGGVNTGRGCRAAWLAEAKLARSRLFALSANEVIRWLKADAIVVTPVDHDAVSVLDIEAADIDPHSRLMISRSKADDASRCRNCKTLHCSKQRFGIGRTGALDCLGQHQILL